MKRLLFILSILAIATATFGQKIATASVYTTTGNTVFGEAFDATKATVSAKYPKGTMLRVTRVDNEVSLVLKVTDQPAGSDIVELTPEAGKLLSITQGQNIKVKVEVLGSKSGNAKAKAKTPAFDLNRLKWVQDSTGGLVLQIPNSMVPKMEKLIADKKYPMPAGAKIEKVRQ